MKLRSIYSKIVRMSLPIACLRTPTCVALCMLSVSILHAPELPAPIIIIENEDQLNKEIAARPQVVVEFYAPWCHTCQQIQKPFEQLSGEPEFRDKVAFAQIDMEKHKQLSKKYAIVGVPTFVYFKQGKKVKQEMGIHNMAQFKDELRSTIRAQFKLAANTLTTMQN